MRFNDLHSSADGLIGKIQGTPGTAGDYAAQGSRAILGFVKDALLGVGELAYEGGKLAVSAQQNMTNPAAMYGQVLDAQILAENVRLGNVTTGTMASGAMSTATSVGNAIIAPVTQPWANGQYVEAVTRGVIEVATLPLTILKSGKLAKGADALTDAATANKATNAADTAADAGDAAKAPEPQGPQGPQVEGNGGKVEKGKGGGWKNAPNIKKWKENGGTVEQHPDGSITYTNKDGKSVTYDTQGRPDFSEYMDHPSGVKEVKVDGLQGDHYYDFKKANEEAGLPYKGKSPPDYTWHHHEDGKTMQLIQRDIHDEFTHAGGASTLRR